MKPLVFAVFVAFATSHAAPPASNTPQEDVAPKALIFRAYDLDQKTGRLTVQFTRVGHRTVFVEQGYVIPGTTLSVTRLDPETEKLTLTDVATKKETLISRDSVLKLPPDSK